MRTRTFVAILAALSIAISANAYAYTDSMPNVHGITWQAGNIACKITKERNSTGLIKFILFEGTTVKLGQRFKTTAHINPDTYAVTDFRLYIDGELTVKNHETSIFSTCMRKSGPVTKF